MPCFYKTDEMEKSLAGAAYSSAAGAWVTGERLIFGKMRMPAGTRSRAHAHANEQFGYCLAGSVRLNVEGEERVLTPGHIAYRPANAVHEAEVLGEADYEFIVAKDAAAGIEGTPAEMRAAPDRGEGARAGRPAYFHDAEAMEKGLAGEGYSPTEGVWVTGERVIFGKMRIPAGGRAEPHSHPNEQFVIVLSGAARMTIAGETETIAPGDIAHVPANAIHSGEILGDAVYVFVTAKDTAWGIQGIKA